MIQYLRAGVKVNWMRVKDLQFEIDSQISKEFIRRHMQINMQKLEEESRNLVQANFYIEAVFRCGGWFEVNGDEIVVCDDGNEAISDELMESFKHLWPYVLYIFNEQDLEEYAEERRSMETLDGSGGSRSS